MNFNTLDLTILKALISNKKHGLDFASEYDAKLFSPEVWLTAQHITNYLKTYKELPTLRVLTEKLSKSNNATKQIESLTNTWNAIEQTKIDSKEYKHDLEKLKTRFAEKQLLSARDGLSKLEAGQVDVSKSVIELQKTIQSIKSLDNQQAYELKNIKDYLPTFVDRFNAKKNNPTMDKGLLTKYSFFDYATNGLKPADFVVIAGESGFGKSLFLNNIAIQVWLQDNKINFPTTENPTQSYNFTTGKNIIYFSLEMPYEDCFHRLLSRLSGVPSRKIENADLTRDEFGRIKACLDFIKEYPYVFKIVDIADASANDLEAILAETGENFDAIFIDYLGIMRPNEKNEDQDWLKQGIIAYEVRAIGRRRGLPIFSAVQLNRKSQGKEATESIGLARLARSATIATHCTHVIQIESRQQEEKHPDFLYHVIKNRKGPKGKGILIKNLACAMLLDKIDGEQPYLNNDINDLFRDQDDISEAMKDLEI